MGFTVFKGSITTSMPTTITRDLVSSRLSCCDDTLVSGDEDCLVRPQRKDSFDRKFRALPGLAKTVRPVSPRPLTHSKSLDDRVSLFRSRWHLKQVKANTRSPVAPGLLHQMTVTVNVLFGRKSRNGWLNILLIPMSPGYWFTQYSVCRIHNQTLLSANTRLTGNPYTENGTSHNLGAVELGGGGLLHKGGQHTKRGAEGN